MTIESKLEKLQDGKLHLLELIPLIQREQANKHWEFEYNWKLIELQRNPTEEDLNVSAHIYANQQLFKRYFGHE